MARPPLPSLAVLLVLALVVVRPGLVLPAATAELSDGGQAIVSAVIDGDTVMLADGRQVILAPDVRECSRMAATTQPPWDPARIVYVGAPADGHGP
jgi:hypothetical protein